MPARWKGRYARPSGAGISTAASDAREAASAAAIAAADRVRSQRHTSHWAVRSFLPHDQPAAFMASLSARHAVQKASVGGPLRTDRSPWRVVTIRGGERARSNAAGSVRRWDMALPSYVGLE